MEKSSSSSKKPVNILLILPKLFLMISILLLMWIVILLSGISVLDFEPDWAGLSLSTWLLVISGLFAAFIVIDIVMYVSPHLFVKGGVEEFISSKPSYEYMDGMKVYEYTYPEDENGGIFSKTYIKINDSTLLRVRNQILAADALWPKKKKNKEEKKSD